MNEAPKKISQGKDKGAEDAGYRVLARKYRPQSFDDLIGQDAMVKTLSNAFESGRIAQAYILTGVRGVGKTTTARILARALNYEPPEGGGAPTLKMPALGRHCEAIMEGRHIDVIEMDAASHNSVDDVRQISDSVRYTPVNARYKIYILDEVHMLSKAAFNALLKTLEEPPAHAKFIFATTEIGDVPLTVLSRCQRFDLRRVEAGVLTEHLARICKQEKTEAEPEALAMIARAAEGSVRDSLSILDQAIAHAEGKVTAEEVRTMLGLADRARVIDLFENLMKGDISAALKEFRAQYDTGADPAVVIADLAEFTHLVTRFKIVPESKDDRSLIEAERQRGSEFAGKLSVRALSRAWQVLTKGYAEVQESEKSMQAAEMVLVRLAYASDLPTPDEALKMLKDGSGAVATGSPARSAAPVSAPRMAVAAEGGARSRPVAQAEHHVQALAGPRLSTLEDIAALAAEKRDLKIKHAVEHYLRLVRLQENRLEVALATGAPSGITMELSAKLSEWMGNRWFVALSDQPGGQTIAEKSAAKKVEMVEDVRSDPLVAAVLARFPDAEIVEVRAPKPVAAEDDLDDLPEYEERGDD